LQIRWICVHTESKKNNGFKPKILRIERIITFQELKLIENEWRGFYSQNGIVSPFLTFEFINLWYECFSEPEDVRIYKVFNGSGAIGFLPVVIEKIGSLRILKSLTNDHCLHSGPLVKNGYEEVFSKIILEEILKDWKLWDVFCYRFSYSFSQFPGLFSDELLNNMNVIGERREQPTYAISLNKSYEEYFRKDLSLNSRKNFMRILNRLKTAGNYRMVECRGIEGLNRWDDFIKLEDSGWKGEKHSSIKKVSQSYQKYYSNLVKLLADKDALDMYFLELNGLPIAGVFGYFEGDIYHWAKIGYDERHKDFSPSNLLILFIIENIIKKYPGVKMFHMFPWDYNYKHRYTNTTATCFETIIYSSTKRGRLIHAFDKLKGNMRKIIRPLVNG